MANLPNPPIIKQSGMTNSDRESRSTMAPEVSLGGKVTAQLTLINEGGPVPDGYPYYASSTYHGIDFVWGAKEFPIELTIEIDGDFFACAYHPANGNPDAHKSEVIEYITYGENYHHIERVYNIPFQVWIGGKSIEFTVTFRAQLAPVKTTTTITRKILLAIFKFLGL